MRCQPTGTKSANKVSLAEHTMGTGSKDARLATGAAVSWWKRRKRRRHRAYTIIGARVGNDLFSLGESFGSFGVLRALRVLRVVLDPRVLSPLLSNGKGHGALITVPLFPTKQKTQRRISYSS